MNLYYIDLFCGAGGVSTGITRAGGKVIACVNHDEFAIKSHKANHPDVLHFTEDITTLDISPIIRLVNQIRANDPLALIVLWASLECTNFSKAKGGKPRDADSRTLACHLYRYIEGLDPDYIDIENVEEFMSWGPLDEKGKPLSRRQGIDYIRWVDTIRQYGYDFDYRILNSADFGAYTSRKRYFAQFGKHGFPLVWPQPTHSKKPNTGLFGDLSPWNPVRECLELDQVGTSIFTRKKPLSERTLSRILAGLKKYVGQSETEFVSKYYSGNPDHKNFSTNEPCHTLTCVNRHALVQPKFIYSYYSSGKNIKDLGSPSPTLTTKDRISVVSTQWIDKNYSGKHNHQSIHGPSGSLTTVCKQALISTKPFILNTNFGNKASSIEKPSPTLLASRRYYYLVNPQFVSKGGSVDQPCFTLIARMDKMPPYLITTDTGELGIEVYETDSPNTKLIKQFMAAHGIADVYMRMLLIPELLRIQGFGEQYKLMGNQAQQKKYIGNSVVPDVVEQWVRTRNQILNERIKTAI
jgi:DNA (cytosine-5)-methyltransferase 1